MIAFQTHLPSKPHKNIRPPSSPSPRNQSCRAEEHKQDIDHSNKSMTREDKLATKTQQYDREQPESFQKE